MMRALWSAASGMKAQQDNMDVVAHNIANVNTFGSKKVRAEFQDLVYQNLRAAGAQSGADSQYPTGLAIGLGTRTAATQRIFTQGNLQSSGNPTFRVRVFSALRCRMERSPTRATALSSSTRTAAL